MTFRQTAVLQEVKSRMLVDKIEDILTAYHSRKRSI